MERGVSRSSPPLHRSGEGAGGWGFPVATDESHQRPHAPGCFKAGHQHAPAWTRSSRTWAASLSVGLRLLGVLTSPRAAAGALAIALSVAVTVGAIGNARAVAAEEERVEVVQLWMLPRASLDGRSVEIGVRGSELAAESYELRLRAGEHDLGSWALALPPGGTWQTTVVLPAGLAERTVATLSRADQADTPYRQVFMRSADGTCDTE
jgi:hypothetical protein